MGLIERIKEPEDTPEEIYEDRNHRLLSISLNPFVLYHGHTTKRHPGNACDSPLHEKHDAKPALGFAPNFKSNAGPTSPSWLDLFYDLALVAALTVFSQTHQVSSSYGVATFVAFFSILWYCWATQVLHDCRFETPDWCNVVAKLFNLGVFAYLAAYSGSFDVTNLNLPPAIDSAATAKEWTASTSWNGLTLCLAIARWGLALQYSIVCFHGRHLRSKILYAQILIPLVAGGCCFAAYRLNDLSIAQLILIFGSIVFEVLATAAIAIHQHSFYLKHSMLCERMALTTLIIIGEGVNQCTESMTKIVSSGIGFGRSDQVQLLSAIVVVFLTFYLNFVTFNKERAVGRTRQQIFTWSHFLLHLTILLMFHGIRRCIIWNSLGRAFEKIFLPIVFLAFNETTVDAVSSEIKADLWLLGLNSDAIANRIVSSNISDDVSVTWSITQILYSIAVKYGVDLPDSVTVAVQSFTNTSNISLEQVTSVGSQIELSVLEPAFYVIPALGGMLFLSQICLSVHKKPQDRYDWIIAGVRLLVGFALCMLGLLDLWPANSGPRDQYFVNTVGPPVLTLMDNSWMLPFLAITLGSVFFFETGLIHIAQFRYRRRNRLIAATARRKEQLQELEGKRSSSSSSKSGSHSPGTPEKLATSNS